MLREDVREINGDNYRIHELAAEPGRRNLVRLLKLIGPALAELVRVQGAKKMDTGVVADQLRDLCLRLEENEFEALIQPFLKTAEIEGEKGWITINPYNAFAGRYGTMLKWLTWNVEFNYADFFGELGITKPQT